MLSILLPVRNEYENLDIIEKIFNENLSDISYEAILINDFSTDNTLQKANEIIKKNKNFRIINNSNKGLGGAMNLGISESKGDFVCIVMADLSDDINDLKKYYELINKVVSCIWLKVF